MNRELSQVPIFVVGYPRSGTTLLQALISTQNGVVSIPETHFFSSVQFVTQAARSDSVEPNQIEKIINRITQRSHVSFPESFAKVFESASTPIEIKKLFESVVRYFLEEKKHTAFERWLEKSPAHALYLHEIHRIYPKAQFLAVIRNPLYAIASWLENFSPNTKFKIEFLCDQWIKYIDSIGSFAAAHPESIRVLRYEDLVADPTFHISELCEFLNLSFSNVSLGKFSETAEQLIMPFEQWKRGVTEGRIVNKNQALRERINAVKIFKIQSALAHKMGQFEYPRELNTLHFLPELILKKIRM